MHGVASHRIASHCDMAKKRSHRLAIVASIGAMDGPLDSFVIGQVLYSLGRSVRREATPRTTGSAVVVDAP